MSKIESSKEEHSSVPRDAVVASIMAKSFTATAEEMYRNLIRSAHSTIVRESRDASTAIINSRGELVAQGKSTIPVLLGAFTPMMDAFLKRFSIREIRPGQALITNDPYNGGQHLDDIALILPIFLQSGQLLGFSGTIAHHIDIGAALPGINPKATDIHQEGLCIPPMIIDLDRDLGSGGVLSAIISGNVRVPDATLGDIAAQVAAAKTGQKRLLELCNQYGSDIVMWGMDQQIEYGNKLMKSAIKKIPDGIYQAHQTLDAKLSDGDDVTIAVTVKVSDCDLAVDFAGTDAQVDQPVNSPYASTISSSNTAIIMTLGNGHIPVNAGSLRPLKINLPKGSVLNPRYPAPVNARMGACFKVFDAVLLALKQSIPDEVIAPSYSAIAAVSFSKMSTNGRTLIYREALGGGYGAGKNYDGASACAITLTNTANVPVEFAEHNYPFLRVIDYRLRTGSGGLGEFRGGSGCVKTYIVLEDGVMFSAYSDHHWHGPVGVDGGSAGLPARFIHIHDGVEHDLDPLVSLNLDKGDLIRVETAGGGGYGAPFAEVNR